MSFYAELSEKFNEVTGTYLEELTNLFIKGKDFVDQAILTKTTSGGIVLLQEEEVDVLHHCYHMMEILSGLPGLVEEAAKAAEEKLVTQQLEDEELIINVPPDDSIN